jgi:hypothetical protein
MVAWCLEQGASVTHSDRHWEQHDCVMVTRRCSPILDSVVQGGDIALFEPLRSRGAPVGQQTLHKVVEMAAFGHDGPEDPDKDTKKQREDRAKHARCMNLVRHLLDVLKLDGAPGDTRGMSSAHGTPICYIPGVFRPERDSWELTWLLLDRGADPAPALKDAEEYGHAPFPADVEACKARNPGRAVNLEGRDRSCCVL